MPRRRDRWSPALPVRVKPWAVQQYIRHHTSKGKALDLLLAADCETITQERERDAALAKLVAGPTEVLEVAIDHVHHEDRIGIDYAEGVAFYVVPSATFTVEVEGCAPAQGMRLAAAGVTLVVTRFGVVTTVLPRGATLTTYHPPSQALDRRMMVRA